MTPAPRWIELWQSVKRYERDGELLAEMSHTNGIWSAFTPAGSFIGKGPDQHYLRRGIESAFRVLDAGNAMISAAAK